MAVAKTIEETMTGLELTSPPDEVLHLDPNSQHLCGLDPQWYGGERMGVETSAVNSSCSNVPRVTAFGAT